ncbi:hypothetical protein Droror1_Dr00016017 [Drosera rotundifolia]
MLMQTLKCLTKSRLQIPHLLPFSSIAACPSPIQQNPCPTYPQRLDLDPIQVVGTFKSWFKTRENNPFLERVFEILRSRDAGEKAGVAGWEMELAQLGFGLNEGFVLEVLRYGNDVMCCLEFFDWAGRQPGFHHTRSTFNAMFKVLSRQKLMSSTLEFLEKYIKNRYFHRVRFFDTLVMGYAVAGKPLTALQVFGAMRYQGLDLAPFAYQVFLNALVETRNFDGAQVVLEQIKMRGFENVVTKTIEMKSLCKQNRLDEAENLFRRLVGGGEKVNGYLLALLVGALCKLNKFAYAGRLMEEFRRLGGVLMDPAYGVWIRHLTKSGQLDSALEFLQHKNSLEGYVPDVFRYNTLILKLLRGNRVQEVYDLLTEMNEFQIVPDRVTMNAALCFFCKIGLVDVAVELFKSRSEYGLTPNSMVYNYLINTLCGDGSIEEACRILENAVQTGCFPGKMTFSILSDALYREGKYDKMNNLVTFAFESKFGISNSAYDKFVHALCRTNRLDQAYLIHSEYIRLNKVPTAKTYTCLIIAFIKSKKGDIAARLLLEMQEKGHTPERSLFRAVIGCLCAMEDPRKHFLQLFELQVSYHKTSTTIYNYYIDGAGHAKKPDLAREIYERMGTSGIIPNLSSDILMLQSYLKNGRISDALNFFDEVGRRREVRGKLYNVMIDGFCKANKSDHALVVLQDARRKGLIPSLRSYEEIIGLLAAESKYELVMMVINDLEDIGRHLSSFIGNVLVYRCLKFRGLYDAWVRTRDSNQQTESSMMLGQMLSLFSGRVTANMNVTDLEHAIQECFPPDIYSYNLLLRRLCIDKIDDALQFFYEICHKGYKPNRWTYDIIVHGLVKHGRKHEARLWKKKMELEGFELTEATSSLI